MKRIIRIATVLLIGLNIGFWSGRTYQRSEDEPMIERALNASDASIKAADDWQALYESAIQREDGYKQMVWSLIGNMTKEAKQKPTVSHPHQVFTAPQSAITTTIMPDYEYAIKLLTHETSNVFTLPVGPSSMGITSGGGGLIMSHIRK